MTKIVGLTGGIGSGKTTVAKKIEKLGVPIYIADLEAKAITDKKSTLKLIAEEFGPSIIEDGKLNRAAMAKIVFSNPEKLDLLNKIIHPLVAQHFKEWLIQHEKVIFVIKETAILFETNSHLGCDYVITVSAPVDLRVSRVKNRDNSSDEEINNRIKNQWTDDKRIALSDFVIKNINLESTSQQVSKIYKEIVNYSL